MGLPPEAIIRQVASTCLTPRHFEIYERYCRGENAEQIGQALNMTPNHVYVEQQSDDTSAQRVPEAAWTMAFVRWRTDDRLHVRGLCR